MAFEQPYGPDPSKRHHARFCRLDQIDEDGRLLWLAAATSDQERWQDWFALARHGASRNQLSPACHRCLSKRAGLSISALSPKAAMRSGSGKPRASAAQTSPMAAEV